MLQGKERKTKIERRRREDINIATSAAAAAAVVVVVVVVCHVSLCLIKHTSSRQDIAPCILNLECSWRYTVNMKPRPPYSEEGWAGPRSRPQCCVHETEIVPMQGIEPQFPGRLARSPINIVTALSQNAAVVGDPSSKHTTSTGENLEQPSSSVHVTESSGHHRSNKLFNVLLVSPLMNSLNFPVRKSNEEVSFLFKRRKKCKCRKHIKMAHWDPDRKDFSISLIIYKSYKMYCIIF